MNLGKITACFQLIVFISTTTTLASCSSEGDGDTGGNGNTELYFVDAHTQVPLEDEVAIDNVWPEHWATERYQSQMDIWKSAMADLPDSVAHAIAHENAERLWSIQ